MKASKAIKRAWKRAGNGLALIRGEDGKIVREKRGESLREWAYGRSGKDVFTVELWLKNKRRPSKPTRVTPPTSLASITTPRANGRVRKAS